VAHRRGRPRCPMNRARLFRAVKALDLGADPTIKSNDGHSPLDLVAKRRDKTYLEMLSGRHASRPRS
jgi:hypothetical protein